MTLGNELPESDIERICKNIKPWMHHFQEKDVLVYGGTGFIGRWLVTTLLEANRKYDLRMNVHIITRSILKAKIILNELTSKDLHFIEHNFDFPLVNKEIYADIAFQGATSSNKEFQESHPETLLRVSQNASSHASGLKSKNDSKPTIIHLSSGAVFHETTPSGIFQPESEVSTSGNLSTYARSKLDSEELLKKAYFNGDIYLQSPRLFAFYGPLLPLDEHFAIGNFLRDGLMGIPIKLTGNPNTTRSYMHPVDLITILLRLVSHKEYVPINVGSDNPTTMIELASLISSMTCRLETVLLNPSAGISNYVPETTFLRNTLNYSIERSLEEGISNWIQWLRRSKQAGF
jgi:dTDP-glucose 4,6-dehydratase